MPFPFPALWLALLRPPFRSLPVVPLAALAASFSTLPKRSATVVANGYTVEEPTMEMVSRAIAVAGALARATAAAAPTRVAFI